MKLATFTDRDGCRIGLVEDTQIVDVTKIAPDLPRDMTALLKLGPEALRHAVAASFRAPRLPLDRVHLEAPVPNPGKFLAIGLNYVDHIREINAPTPEFPACFAKVSTCINGPFDPVHRPRVSDSLDYEGELGFVIGRGCRHVPREQAAAVIAGFVVVDDFTVREWVEKTPQVVIPKSFDTHGPFGPYLVTADEVEDPHGLKIRTWVNDTLRQNSTTDQMIFDCYDLVEILSRAVTLEPGDVITTGTPYGVGEGFTPRRYLQPGDVVKVEVEGLGFIENQVIDEPQDTAIL